MNATGKFTAALTQLEGARRSLASFLSILDDPDREDGCLREAWARCVLPAASLEEVGDWSQRLDREDVDRLTRAIEDVARMNAIAVSAVEDEKDRLGDLLGRTRKSRRDLSFYLRDAVSGDTGQSCDMAG
jgi:hypothetical protein